MSKRTAERIPYKPCKKCGCTERYKVGVACPVCAAKRSVKRMRKYQGLPEPTRPEPTNCECCGQEGQMRLDHDHISGAFRGWLCHKCNAGIGLLGDNLNGLLLAVNYLCPS